MPPELYLQDNFVVAFYLRHPVVVHLLWQQNVIYSDSQKPFLLPSYAVNVLIYNLYPHIFVLSLFFMCHNLHRTLSWWIPLHQSLVSLIRVCSLWSLGFWFASKLWKFVICFFLSRLVVLLLYRSSWKDLSHAALVVFLCVCVCVCFGAQKISKLCVSSQ